MSAKSSQLRVDCTDCGMHFSSHIQLLNHKKRFCTHSGYDNLEGLAKIQFHGTDLSHQPKLGRRNYLQNYGSQSIPKIDQQQLNALDLEKDMKNIYSYQRQAQAAHKYTRAENENTNKQNKGPNNSRMISIETADLSGLALAVSQINHVKVNNNFRLHESELEREVRRFDKTKDSQDGEGPTYIQELKMRQFSVLDKSNSSVGRMGAKQRVDYAKMKLDELQAIKEQYLRNGGNKKQFSLNLDKMTKFYQQLVEDNHQLLRPGYQSQVRTNQQSQIGVVQQRQIAKDNTRQKQKGQPQSYELINSRCGTPILKLRQFPDQPKSVVYHYKKKPDQANQHTRQPGQVNQLPNPSKHNQLMNGVQAVNPQVIVVPYPPQAPSNGLPGQGYKLLQRMMELKSQENQKLMQILVKSNQQQQPNSNHKNSRAQPRLANSQQKQFNGTKIKQMNGTETEQLNSSNGEFASNIKGDAYKKGRIDVEDDYQFKKSMIEQLISEEKVLMALQQEELDQLKLLSQLPKELQDIKMETVIKSSETRHQIEKHMLKLKMERIAYQAQVQAFQEDRRLTNDAWAGEERKKMLMNQWNNPQPITAQLNRPTKGPQF